MGRAGKLRPSREHVGQGHPKPVRGARRVFAGDDGVKRRSRPQKETKMRYNEKVREETR